MPDINSKISPKRAFANTSATAAGTGDNTAITGDIFDRDAMNYPKSCSILIPFTATLAQGETLTLKSVILQHDDDSALGTASSFYAPADQVVATGPTGGGTVKGCAKYGVDLHGAKRYVRLKCTPDLSASGTDTAAISGELIFADSYIQPAV